MVTEAAEKSGSLHTADFAYKQKKRVLAVPGDVTSSGSVSTNQLIKEGAGLVTSYLDVLAALGVKRHGPRAHKVQGRNPNEQTILDLLLSGVHCGAALLERSKLSISDFNHGFTMLEIDGKIRSLGANQWVIC